MSDYIVHKPRWARVLALALLVSCGHGGSGGSGGGGDKPKDEENPPPPDDGGLALTTNVDVHGFPYELPFLASCMRSFKAPSVPTLKELVVDGSFDEWALGSPQLEDPMGDAPAATDILGVAVGRAGSDLAIFTLTALGEDAALRIELGGAVVRKGAWHTEIRTRLELRGGLLAKWRDDGYESLRSEDYRVARGPHGIELALKAEVVGDAVSWPVWWIRVESRDAEGSLSDGTSALYVPTLLNADHSPVAFGGCTKWSGQKGTFAIQHLRDAAGVVPADFPITLTAERAYQLTRLAFDAALDRLGRPKLPVSRIPVIATAYDPTPTPEPADLEGAFLARGLWLDVRSLGPTSTNPFPHGPIFERAVAHVVDLYFIDRFPAAPWYLRLAARTRIADEVVSRTLGLSYWLDRYRPGVLPFLAKDDEKEPVPLSVMAARLADPQGFERAKDRKDYLRVAEAKAIALGHVFGRFVSVPALVKAWEAAGRASVTDDEAALVAFREALRAQYPEGSADAELNKARIDALFPGWLEAGAYEAEHEPSAAGDDDGDGLPTYLERALSLDPAKPDTDGDGWTDLAEVIVGSDPRTKTKKPDILSPDGSFADWLELMPKRVILDVGSLGTCPKAADITHYSAVANRDQLLIGAIAKDFYEDEPKARWEALIDILGENRVLMITATSDSYAYEVREASTRRVIHTHQRAMPMGRGTVEWAIDRKQLGIKTHFNRPEVLRLRLRTLVEIDGVDRLCDETAWFSPFVKRSE